MPRDDEEFTMIFNDTFPGLCRFVECLLGDRGGAQDIAQESFLRFYRKAPGDLPVQEARFWLYRVARNLALNELSKRQARGRLLSKFLEVLRPAAPSPEEGLVLTERQRLVLTLLETLPPGQRAALLLREQEEMSYREIARVLEITESKVKVDIFRARNALRARWAELQNISAGALCGKD
jgi:RNA polymerase sigma-70 factor (ECF subfamily)